MSAEKILNSAYVVLCWVGCAVFAVFIGQVCGMVIWCVWKGGAL